MNRPLLAGISLLLYATLTVSSHGADWPSFRGPNGNGISLDNQLPTQWNSETNIRWKAKLPRPANGSPIVSNGAVFVTSAEDEEGRERSLYCFDRKTGDLRWKQTVKFDKVMPTHETNPYCGTTPVADGKQVVVWHGSAGLYCYDFQGRQRWSRDLGEYRHIWGYGTSPILYQGRVILHSGPGDRVTMAALDVNDGSTIWEVEEPHTGTHSAREDGKYQGSWTTPLIARVNGHDQILCAMPTRLVAYEPESGKLVWWCQGLRGERGNLAYSSPVIAGELCVVTGGFQGPGMAVKLGSETGDVTASGRVWWNEKNPQSIGSGVYLEGYVYRPNAGPGTIDCLDPKTGKVVWSDRGAGGSNIWGSIVSAGGICYSTDQSGVTLVFQPSPEGIHVLAKNPLNEPSNSTPAISDSDLFIRTAGHLYCISQAN